MLTIGITLMMTIGVLMTNKDESKIPKGPYCYDGKGVCPYWSINSKKPKQLNGHCSYLNQSDWEEDSVGLLWDQCKSCEVNDSYLDGDDDDEYDCLP